MGFRCKVVPYALFDVLCALECTKTSSSYVDYFITKEDGDLIIGGKEVYVRKIQTAMACSDSFEVR